MNPKHLRLAVNLKTEIAALKTATKELCSWVEHAARHQSSGFDSSSYTDKDRDKLEDILESLVDLQARVIALVAEIPQPKPTDTDQDIQF